MKRGVFIARGVKKPTAWQKISNWVYDIQMAAGQQTNFTPTVKVPEKLGFFGESNTGKKMFE